MTDPHGPAAPKPRAPKPVAPIDWARQQQAERAKCTCRFDPAAERNHRPWCNVFSDHPSVEQQPARHTVDTITSDALDQLYQRVEIAEAVARDLDGASNVAVRAIQLMNEAGRSRDAAEQRAEQAEAAIARVRRLADDWAVLRTHGSAAYELRAALDEPKEPRP